ncbi:MAG TPA: hypothetical protein VLB51_02695 [Methylomirabilota bacterium]|nr:hypothetical protein [Methylomirabilota bacterium]
MKRRRRIGILIFSSLVGLLTALETTGSAAEPGRVPVRSFDPCPGLESLTNPNHDSELLPITTETVLPEAPVSWAGPAMARCGPVLSWVDFDHVKRLSGKSQLNVRTVLWAEPPYLVLGAGFPTLVHAQTENGVVLEAEELSVPNWIRFKVRDSAGVLDTVLTFPLDRGPLPPGLRPTRLQKFRATVPTVVVKGFRPLVKIADPYRLGTAPLTTNGMTVAIDEAQRQESFHWGSVRVTATSRNAGELWNAFSGIPAELVDSTGRVVLRRWLMRPIGGERWLTSIDFEAEADQQPPFTLIVYEPNAVNLDLPLEWDSADLPPRRVEQEPIPPSAPVPAPGAPRR